MPPTRTPWFRIYRIDTPVVEQGGASGGDYRAFWRIAETTYRVRVWTPEALERRPELVLPSEAQRVGDGGWMLLQPIDGESRATPVGEESGGVTPHGLAPSLVPKPGWTRTGSEDEAEPVGS